jgi:hypothetical protein
MSYPDKGRPIRVEPIEVPAPEFEPEREPETVPVPEQEPEPLPEEVPA